MEFRITYTDIGHIVDKPDFLENLLIKLDVSPLVFATIFQINTRPLPDVKDLEHILKNPTTRRLLYILDKQPEIINHLYTCKRVDV